MKASPVPGWPSAAGGGQPGLPSVYDEVGAPGGVKTVLDQRRKLRHTAWSREDAQLHLGGWWSWDLNPDIWLQGQPVTATETKNQRASKSRVAMPGVEREDRCHLGLWGSLSEEVAFWSSPIGLGTGDSPMERSCLGWPRLQGKEWGMGSWCPQPLLPPW